MAKNAKKKVLLHNEGNFSFDMDCFKPNWHFKNEWKEFAFILNNFEARFSKEKTNTLQSASLKTNLYIVGF